MKIVNAYVDTYDVVFRSVSEDGSTYTDGIRRPIRYTAFIRKTDLEQNKEGFTILTREKKRGNIEQYRESGEWFEVTFQNRNRRDDFCSRKGLMAEIGIPTFDGDLSPAKRVVIDEGIGVGRPRAVYIDIETDPRQPISAAIEGFSRVLCWSLVDEDGFLVDYSVLEDENDESERRLLDRMWNSLRNYDLVIAWNGEHFDFPVVQKRSKKIRVKCDPRKYLWLDQLKLFKRWNIGSSESGEEKESFSLEAVGQRLLGEGKRFLTEEQKEEFFRETGLRINSPSRDGYFLWKVGGKWRQLLVDYNIRDTELLPKLEAKTGYMAGFMTLCEICKVLPDSRGLLPTNFVDGFLYQIAQGRGEHFPTKHFASLDEEEESDDQFAGAYVMPPQVSGIVEDVFVGDFASLYPAIIVTFNMSLETKLDLPIGKYCTVPATGVHFSTEKVGILPYALSELLRLRKHYKSLVKEAPTKEARDEASRLEKAYKIATNSFYGVLGSKFSRYYDVAIAESVTLSGQWLIKETNTVAESDVGKCRAVYSDTDSCFLEGASPEKFAEFVRYMNEVHYPKLCVAAGCIDNRIQLAIDKHFKRLVFTASKRYVGVTSSGKSEIKGLEYKRGDQLRLTRTLQKECIDLFVKGSKDPDEYAILVSSYFHKVLNDSLPVSEIKISKGISRELEDYKTKTKKDGTESSLPAHVRVAKLMEERGDVVGEGTRVEYVVLDETTKPPTMILADEYDGAFDRNYYWSKLIWPPTERLLTAMFPNYNWGKFKITGNRIKLAKTMSKQISLFDLTA